MKVNDIVEVSIESSSDDEDEEDYDGEEEEDFVDLNKVKNKEANRSVFGG
jgi:hypothetical protein